MLPHFQRKLPRTPSCGRWRLCELLLPPYVLDWVFVCVMRGFLRACKRSLLLSVFPFELNTFHQTVMQTPVVICARLLCSSWCPILHLFCLHLKVASALVAKMRNKSTTRTVSHFCVRRCLLFAVRAHVQPPLLYIREEEGTRRCSTHCTFVEYLSPMSKLHHTLCSK